MRSRRSPVEAVTNSLCTIDSRLIDFGRTVKIPACSVTAPHPPSGEGQSAMARARCGAAVNYALRDHAYDSRANCIWMADKPYPASSRPQRRTAPRKWAEGHPPSIRPVCQRRDGSRSRRKDSPNKQKPSRARGEDLLGGLYSCNAAVCILLSLDLLYDLRVEGGSGEYRPACIYWGQSGRAGARDVAAATAATVWKAQVAGR